MRGVCPAPDCKAYEGNELSPALDVEARSVADLERRNARDPFRLDPYGVRAPLADKRVARGWHDASLEAVGDGQGQAVRRLLRWRGGVSGWAVFPDVLPWEEV